MEYSPEAMKSMQASLSRESLWWPTLKRTATKLILCHALRGNGKHTARVMAGLGWKWDSKLRYFHADLTLENLDAVLAAWSVNLSADRARLHLNLSAGVSQLMEKSQCTSGNANAT